MGISIQLGSDPCCFDELTSLLPALLPGGIARAHPRVGGAMPRRAQAPHRRTFPPSRISGCGVSSRAPSGRTCVARPHAPWRTWRLTGSASMAFGVGGALEKTSARSSAWVCEELSGPPAPPPGHLRARGPLRRCGRERRRLRRQPSRVARNAAIYTPDGRFQRLRTRASRDFASLTAVSATPARTTQRLHSSSVQGEEILSATLATIHNEWFTASGRWNSGID